MNPRRAKVRTRKGKSGKRGDCGASRSGGRRRCVEAGNGPLTSQFHGCSTGLPTAGNVDVLCRRCQCAHVKSDKGRSRPADAGEERTTGMKMVEKYWPRMSRLTDAERQKLTERGLQIIYGESAEAKPAHRR